MGRALRIFCNLIVGISGALMCITGYKIVDSASSDIADDICEGIDAMHNKKGHVINDPTDIN